MEEVGFNEGMVAGESAGSIYSACLDATVPKPLSQSPTTTEGRRRGDRGGAGRLANFFFLLHFFSAILEVV
jgi:hypothetical protein